MKRVALISDIHRHLEERVLERLAGVDYIVCAGDTEDPRLLAELELIAPLTAVRGNCDWGPWADQLPKEALLQVEELHLLVIHNINYLSFKPDPHKIQLVVFGHTHRFQQYFQDGVYYLNPGSVSEPRGGQAKQLVILQVEGSHFQLERVGFLERGFG